METLIPVVNKLQDVFGAIGQRSVDLPQIVVVGSQSAGKSSVLEGLVGRDFLPRGTGVVTRRPLVLQLYSLVDDNGPIHHTDHVVEGESTVATEEWGEFLHLPGQRFYDFSEIRNEIEKETERLTGSNKGLSNKSINLKIYSPYVLNLTLVDLPGITKVPTGDQPEDVEDRIRTMCLEFISNPNAIILAVTAANSDLVNSDGLKMARMVDPDGDRTIGVLTKVDIMDAGTDACDILQNHVVPLRRGYIAIKNRSQKAIIEGQSVRDGLTLESQYFASHSRYRSLAHKCGTENLARTLNGILMHHIRDTLPDIKNRINSMMVETDLQITGLGESTDTLDGAALGGLLLKLLSNFASKFGDAVDGRGSPSRNVELNELYGGARISYIFNDVFGRSLRSLDPFEGLDDEDIRTAIANANGPRPSLFVPEISFDLLVRRQIARLEQPGLQCVDLVFCEMQRMALQSETTEMIRFPKLRDRLFEIVNQTLRECVQPTQKMISNLIQIELAYINTSHPDFIGGAQAIAQLHHQRVDGSSSSSTSSMSNKNNNKSFYDNSKENSRPPNPPSPNQSNSSNSNIDGSKSPHDSKSPGESGYFDLFRPSSSRDIRKRRDSDLVKLPQVPEKMRSSHLTVSSSNNIRERGETEIIKSLIQSYFDIVKKNFMDMVPKTIMHFLVNKFRDGLQNQLVGSLYTQKHMTTLLQETDDVAARRRNCREVKELLSRAMEIVNEVRDFNSFK